MNESQDRFIEYLKNKMQEMRVNFGIEVYNYVFEKYVMNEKGYNSAILDYFLKASYIYFDDCFEVEDAIKLKNTVEFEINEIQKSDNTIQDKRNSKALKNFCIKCFATLHKCEHILIRRRKTEDNMLYQTYEEFLDILEGFSKKVFIHFDKLVKELEISKFSIQESFEIILAFAQLNLKNFNKSEITPIVDELEFRNHEFEHISKKEIDELLENGTLNEFLACNSKKNKLKRQEVNDFIEKNPLDINRIIENCRVIDKHCIQLSELSEEDIISIYHALIGLEIDKKLCIKIAAYLNKKIKKLYEEQKTLKVKSKKIIRLSLSKKETNLIAKELQQYFDFNKMKAVKVLSLNEIIYCISLLMKISADSKTIDEFLLLTEKENRKENPIYLYVDLYNKLLAYKDRYGITGILNNIEHELEKMFICSNQEYEQIKLSIAENIKYALNIIGNNYEYEKQEAEKIKSFTNKL